MKGLNCYASFCDDPGIEKLLSIAQVKRSFLLPVTPSHVQRESLTLHLAAGKTKGLLTLQFSYWPAAAIFSLATLCAVTLSFVQREPFFRNAADGLLPNSHHLLRHFSSSAVFFSLASPEVKARS